MTKREEELTWCIVIGRFFLAFGQIEYASYRWIAQLSKDKAMLEMLPEMQFCKRVKIIHSLIRHSEWSNEDKRDTTQKWIQAKELSERVRNVIAHNPLYALEQDNPKSVRVINAKKIQWIEPPLRAELLTVLSWDDVSKAGTTAGHLAKTLFDFDFKR